MLYSAVMKRWLSLALKFLVSGLLIWFLFRDIDLAATFDRLASTDPLWLAAAMGLLVVQAVVMVFRWQSVCVAIATPLPFLRVLQFLFIGLFFNQVLPASVGGDAFRIYKVHRFGRRLGEAVNGVMLERIAAFVAIFVLVVITTPFLFIRLDDDPARWLFPALAAPALAGVGVLMILDRLPSGLHRWRLIRGLADLAADTRRVFLSPANMLRVMSAAVLGHVLLSLVVYALARGLAVDIGFVDCLVLFPPVILISALPISIAGWGVREGAMVTAFAFAGISAESALVISVLFGLLLIVIALPGGVAWFGGDGRAAAVAETVAADRPAATEPR